MIFTERRQLTILQLKNGEESISIKELMEVLSEQPSNMIYCENDGKLSGIISTGDIYRADKRGKDRVMVNRNFTYLYHGEYMKAKSIFKEKKNINAIPVVTKENVLIGDYARWDDLLKLEFLIETDMEQCIEKCKEWKGIILVRPYSAAVDRWKIFKKLKESFESKNETVQCIAHSEVSQYIDGDSIILFVDHDEIFACATRIKIILGDKYDGRNLRTYIDVFHKEIGFSEEECAMYLKKLQDKGVKIIGLTFEESAYYKQLVKKIEDKFTMIGEVVKSKLPKSMYKDFFDNLYSEEYAESIFNMPIDYENNGGVYTLKDCKSQYCNVVNGERFTMEQPEHYTRSIYMYGPCYIYGYCVEDKNTIESLLQRRICCNGGGVKVINCGTMEVQSILYSYLPRIICTQLREGDIIIVDRPPQNIVGVQYIDLTKVLEDNHVRAEWFADMICHCNHRVNQIYTNAIYHTLKSLLNEKVEEQGKLVDKDENFIKYLYLDRYFAGFNFSKYEKIGSVVMNCNPFTHGHRYLIEQALNTVDFLIIFVVEQDRSFFSFIERFNMVRKGVEDLQNVMVVPSGPFIVSQMTIPEYFSKQMSESAAEHDEQDFAIFAEKIALPLGIKYRFFGEEPFDKVTNQYNISAKKILPQYGIEAVIIPRKTAGEKAVSASTVRKYLDEKNIAVLDELLPETTRKALGVDFQILEVINES